LAGDLGINPNTVAKTYGELQRAGLLVARRGSGTFVSETRRAPTSSARRRRDHELRPIVDRLLADALSLGVPFQDILNYLHAIDARGSTHPSSAIES
jgi:GntR family transcriptional regulator